MFLEQALLFFIGLSAGGVIAAGIFAFLAIIGIFPRIIGMTGTTKHILLCETMMITGGVFGNVIDLYPVADIFGRMMLPDFFGISLSTILLLIWGLAMGVFVGCLVMSLAETLKALPVLSRRIHLAVGLQYVILGIATGKLLGALIYFIYGFGGE